MDAMVSRLLNLLLLLLMAACVHELPWPDTQVPTGGTVDSGTGLKTCSTDTIYFEQTILPLLTSLCGSSGCHGTSNPREFQMIYSSNATSYSGIKNRLVSTSSPTSTNKLIEALIEMAGQGVSGYVSPTGDQLNTLKKWISQGAKYNSCTACDTTTYTYAANIAPIFSTYCIGCHTGASAGGSVDLSSYSKIQTELNMNPGRLIGSIEWSSPYTGTKAMPQGGGKLPDCYVVQIKKWIAAGALNN